MEKAQKKESKHILGWIFGILFLMGGIGMVTESFISALLTVALGLLLLPPSRKWLEEKINIQFSRGALIGIGVVLLGIASVTLPSDTEEPNDTNTAEAPIEQAVEKNESEPEKTVEVAAANEQEEDVEKVETESVEPELEEVETQQGINVSRTAFTNKFENSDYLEVTFGAGVPVDGADNYTANDGAVTFQLLGPEENLTQATVWVFASSDDVASNTVALAAMADFINVFDQSLNDDSWLIDEIEAVTPGVAHESSIERNGRNVRFEYEPNLGSFMVIVEANQ